MKSRHLAAFANYVRLVRAKHRHKTVRFKVGDLRSFYAQMNAEGIPYVVLRWGQFVPLDAVNPEAFEHDIDHLIGRRVIDKIRRFASDRPGPAKCDFYSMTGERGSAYRSVPYLTPALAHEVLRNRVMENGVFYVPNPRDMYLAFAFHLVYHKGVHSGIVTGLDGADRNLTPVRDYEAELKRLAGEAGIELPNSVTLLALHQHLKDHEWNMPFDLMVRWPDQHDVMRGLTAYERAALAPLAAKAHDINVFIVRNDCVGPENLEIVRRLISDRFDILDHSQLSDSDATRIARLTRGGNWFEKHYEGQALPTHLFVCRQRAVAGPLPDGMSASKVAARYPHISHTDVLIKRDIRAAVNKNAGGPATRIGLHATDNALESAETLAAFKGAAALDYLSTIG